MPPNNESETQSMATNVTRFMNYRLISRNNFFNRGAQQPQQVRQTLLVPEHNQENEDRFRSSLYTNFGRTQAVTARTYRTSQLNENESEAAEGEGEIIRDPRATLGVDVAMNTNGFSTYGVQQNACIAKYKLDRDPTHVGDRKLMDQEGTNPVNTKTIVFFILCIISL